MDFNLTAQQQELVDNLNEWLDQCEFNATYFDEHYQSRTYPLEFFKAVYDSPFGKLGLPEDIGGTPATIQDLCLIATTFGKRGFATNVAKTMGILNVSTHGTDKQKQQCVEAAATGNVPYALAFTEPEAGSDAGNYQTTALKRDGKYILNGTKTMIMHASYAPYLLVIARDPESEETSPLKAMSMFIVPTDAPGITINPLRKIGCKLFSESEIILKDVEIDADALLGEEGKGFTLMMGNMEIERTLVACDAYGQAYQAYELACKHANERVQFGKPIGTYQLIQEKIVDMRIKLDTMFLMIMQTAWKKDNDVSVRIDSGLVKLYAARAAFEVADDALQVFGGYGYYEEYKVSQLWRDTRQARVAGGTDEIMIRSAGKDILRSLQN